MVWIVLAAIGLTAGIIGALVGLGGGIIIVPALLFLAGSTDLLGNLTPQRAVGVSTVIMIFTGLSSTLAYLKKKTGDYKAGLIFFAGSGPGGIIGAFANKSLQIDAFSLYFGSFVILISLVLLVKDQLKPVVFKEGKHKITKTIYQDGQAYTYGYHPILAVFLSFGVGFCSGLFGIGGGSLMVPAMMLLFFFPPHVAVATSMFMVFLSSITNSITHIYLGNVIWPYVLALIPGAWFGAKLGVMINSRLTGKSLATLLKAVLIIIGLRLIINGIIG